MDSKELCKWLRANSSGIYRPSAEAADRIEQLQLALDVAMEWNWLDEDAPADIRSELLRLINE